MPVFSLFWGEGFKEGGRDHVLDADEAGVGFVRVVEETLADIVILTMVSRLEPGGYGLHTEVSAVVVRLDATVRLMGVCMEGIQVSANTLNRSKVLGSSVQCVSKANNNPHLGHSSTSREDLVFWRERFSQPLVSHGYVRHLRLSHNEVQSQLSNLMAGIKGAQNFGGNRFAR